MTDRSNSPFKLAYVMTHYPRVALTFISGEVDQVEELGGRILPIVMNSPAPADVSAEDARERARRSFYLKGALGTVLGAVAGTFVRHPIKMTRLTLTALRSARADVGLIVRRLAHLSYGATAARECDRRDIHHLHAQFGLAPATIAWFACEIMNFRRAKPTSTWSFTIHGFHDFINETDGRLDLKAESASFVVCISDFTRAQLCRVTDPRLWDRFHVVRCGIDLSQFPQRSEKAVSSVPRVVVLGRLSPEKGHSILLEAVAHLISQGTPVQVEIIGDGPFADDIRRQEAALGLGGRVIYAGELLPAEVAQRLSEADIFCMASFAEGLPISIMEAMAVGVPVVTTWVGGIPELAVNGVTAMTVPPGNSAALGAAIKQLIEDPALRERLVRGAREAVEQMHSRECNAAELMRLYQGAVASKVPA